MTRDLNPRQFALIAELSRARELEALSALAVAAAERDAIEKAVVELASRNPQATTPQEAQALEKWQKWRQNGLRDLNVKLAAATAAYQLAVQRCGRSVAENDVVDKLRKKAEAQASIKRARRNHHIS